MTVLIHERDVDLDVGACLPRIELSCVDCGAIEVYCHLSRPTLTRYLDARDADGNSTWQCRRCELRDVVLNFASLLTLATLLALALMVFGADGGW